MKEDSKTKSSILKSIVVGLLGLAVLFLCASYISLFGIIPALNHSWGYRTLGFALACVILIQIVLGIASLRVGLIVSNGKWTTPSKKILAYTIFVSVLGIGVVAAIMVASVHIL